MDPITVVGLGLSALAVAGLLGLLRDCLVRRPLEVFGVRVTGWPARGVRLAGVALLLGGFAVGVLGLPLASTSETASAVAGSDTPPAAAITTTWRLPFYVRTATHQVSARGAKLGGSVERTLQLPWVFLCCVVAYGLAVTRPRKRSVVTESVPTSP